MGVDSGVEQEQAVESMQMGETRRTLISALSEPDSVYDIRENRLLKENWITEAIGKLESPIVGDSGMILSPSDANLAVQNERGLAGTYLRHLGSGINVEELKEIIRGDRKLPIIKREELDFPTEPRIAWVVNDLGIKNLISTTKIDGVQVELDTHQIGSGPETTGYVHPILHISTR